MNRADTIFVPASKAATFAALNDPGILRACSPGCERPVRTVPHQFTARIVLKIGPAWAGLDGAVTLAPSGTPNRFTLTGEGEGGAAGFANGRAEVTLAGENGATRPTCAASAKIGGWIAQMGSRLVQRTTDQLSAACFENVAADVSSGQPAPNLAPNLARTMATGANPNTN